MKKYLLLLFVCGLGLSSCLKKGNDPYQEAQNQLTKDEAIIQQFIADKNIPAVRHETGVYYQIIDAGSGNYDYTNPNNSYPTVTVKYTGRLLDGTVFDSSDSATFALANVIDGWKIGVPLIQKGGKIRLLIPSGYGYGTSPISDGTGKVIIPANSILDFDIKLLNVQ